ncbi:O-antigen ligase family protein [Azonexus caeni]|uniref:O-antigen ligase family protein n=1 Tax=Azonexus caeni TaxID=266126 RepID=UPI003A8C45F3
MIDYDNRSLRHIFCYIFSFVSIVVSDDVFFFGTIKDGESLMALKYSIYLFLSLWFVFRQVKQKLDLNLILILIFIFSSLLATQLVNNDFSFGYYYQFLIFLLAAFIVRECNFEVFLISAKKIIFWLGVLSLIIYFLNMGFSGFFDWAPVVVNRADVPVKNLYVGYVYVDESIKRNSSIFREPGVFAVYIFFALLVEIFIEKKLSLPRVFVFLCMMMTTYSTSGIICSFLLMFFSFKAIFSKTKYGVFVYLIITLALVSSLFVQDLNGAVFHKLQSDSDAYGSTISRTASLVVPFFISLSNPFFGVGLNEYSILFRSISQDIFGVYLNSDGQSTNTYMAIAANYGWLLGMLFFYLTYKISRRLTVDNVSAFYVSILFILILSSQDLRYSLFVLSLLMFGCVRGNKVFYR